MNKIEVKPMYLGESLLFFGIPGAILYWNIYYGVPLMNQMGVPLIVSFPLALYGLLGLLFFASLVAFKLEGNRLNIESLKRRFRLNRMNKKMWLISIGAFIILQLLEPLLMGTGKALANIPFFSPPDVLPSFMDPRKELELIPVEFMGTPLSGNWWIILVWALCLACNIFGEEFWWRGYILPRQEAAFGKKAWLVNGILWLLLFHTFLKWNYIVMIPICLLVPYLSQRYQNTWMAAIIHGIGNALIFVIIIPGILK